MTEEWTCGDFPAPEWIQTQSDWFVWCDLDGTSWFQTAAEDGTPIAAMAPKGTVVSRDESGEWLLGGKPMTPR